MVLPPSVALLPSMTLLLPIEALLSSQALALARAGALKPFSLHWSRRVSIALLVRLSLGPSLAACV